MELDDEKHDPPRGLKKGLFVIPTMFTAANVGMGFLAVLWSVRGFHAAVTDAASAYLYFDHAAIAMGLAILFDTLDGRVARATGTTTEIGVQFDSLADVLTFGLAPTALIYCWAIAPNFPESSASYNVGVMLLFVYLMSGTFRLARFNLQATRPHVIEQGSDAIDKKNFVGLPIPAAAGLLAAIVHYSPAPLNLIASGSGRYYSYLIFVLVAVLSVLMISKIRYSSFKSAGAVRMSFMLLVPIAAFGMLMWFYSQYALIVISGIYVSSGFASWIYRLTFGRRQSRDVQPQSVNSV